MLIQFLQQGRVGRKKKNVDGLKMVEGEGGSKITKMLTFG